MTLTTRRPTGKPPWPIMLIAGAEKTGKSYACAAASADPRIDRTLWVGIGEDDPDELGALPGADFEIVEHVSTYAGILAAVRAAVAEPGTNLVVVDSMTQLWDRLSNAAQAEANDRADAKAAKYNKASRGDEDVTIGFDLWNKYTRRHKAVVDALKANRGPVLLTSRLEVQTVMGEDGQPVAGRNRQPVKDYKVKTQKALPYDVDVVVELHARDEAYLTAVRSLKFTGDPSGRTQFPNFTVTGLWDRLGVGQDAEARRFDPTDGSQDADPATGPQQLATVARDWLAEAELCATPDEVRDLWRQARDAGQITSELTSQLNVVASMLGQGMQVAPQTLADAINQERAEA